MISWIAEHWTDILAIYGGIVAVCTVIVKLTKTDKDDKILAKIVKFADFFSTAFTSNDKELLTKALEKRSKK